jgi:hypothetical protein
MTSYCWEEEYAGIEFWFVDVISRRFFIVLFCVFFFEFGYYEWSDDGDEFLLSLFDHCLNYGEKVICECWNEVGMEVDSHF